MSRPIPVRGPRLWLMRLAALLLVPLAFVLVEVALRLLGVGYPTGFLVPLDREHLISNADFSRRFFPPTLARPPVPFKIKKEKPDGVTRIFVVGGSAARGTPEPAFGVPRMLEAVLEESYPGQKFEVLNAAVTAINSHVALDIVRDVATVGNADLIVVYLGNNEVVGPWGAASVLGDFTPSHSAVRAGLHLRSLRLGQLMDRILSPAPPRGGWRGLEMFLEQRVTRDDPRLQAVYGNFEANLSAMVDAAKARDVPIALSTVAVNLSAQPPFAPIFPQSISDADQERFKDRLDEARRRLFTGDVGLALDEAEALCAEAPEHAGAHYLKGLSLLASQRRPEARQAFEEARDLDTLRFRADSEINRVIRHVAELEDVPLVDAADALGQELADPRHFLEHVHLRFEGNFTLALLFRQVIAGHLSLSTNDEGGTDSSAADSDATSPHPSAIARRLAFTPADALAIESDILNLVRQPPFRTGIDELRMRHAQIQSLQRSLLDPRAREGVAKVYLERLEKKPEDLLARRRWGEILESWNRPEDAVKPRRELVDALPTVAPWHRALAAALARSDQMDEATSSLEEAARRFGPGIEAEIRIDFGAAYEDAGKLGRAREQYRRANELDPDNPLPSFNLAMLAAQSGEIERAIATFSELTAQHPDFAPAQQNLGVAYEKNGDFAQAEETYRAGIAARPEMADGYHRLAVFLQTQGRPAEALESYAEALKRRPDHGPTYFALGDFYLETGDAARAAELYRQGLAFQPRVARAHENLRRALAQLEARGNPEPASP